jgi:hypothetical protein
MIRSIAMIVGAAIALSLAACGNEGDDKAGQPTEGAQQPADNAADQPERTPEDTDVPADDDGG